MGNQAQKHLHDTGDQRKPCMAQNKWILSFGECIANHCQQEKKTLLFQIGSALPSFKNL